MSDRPCVLIMGTVPTAPDHMGAKCMLVAIMSRIAHALDVFTQMRSRSRSRSRSSRGGGSRTVHSKDVTSNNDGVAVVDIL